MTMCVFVLICLLVCEPKEKTAISFLQNSRQWFFIMNANYVALHHTIFRINAILTSISLSLSESPEGVRACKCSEDDKL